MVSKAITTYVRNVRNARALRHATRVMREGEHRLSVAGKLQHAWNAFRAPGSVVSLLAAFLFAFVMSACASAPPGTIGAKMGQQKDGRLFVREAPPGQGAELAGLEPDDEILAFDGHPVKAMTEADVRSAVRGDAGTVLVVTVERNGQRRDVKVTRTPLKDAPARSSR